MLWDGDKLKLFNRKAKFEAEYQSIVNRLDELLSNPINVQNKRLIEDIIIVHANYPLNEEIIKYNGMLNAIYYFYLDDVSGYLKQIDLVEGETKDKVKHRIEADQRIIEELKELITFADTLNELEVRKAYLEKKLGIMPKNNNHKGL